jgi:hypothetical protein
VKSCDDYEDVSGGVSDTTSSGRIGQAYSILTLGQVLAPYPDLD